MRKSRFTEAQIVEILKKGEAGVPIAAVTLNHERESVIDAAVTEEKETASAA